MRACLLPWLLVLGCGSTPADGDEGGTDATTLDAPNDSGADGATKDTGTADTASDSSSNDDSASDAGTDAPPDAPSLGCQTANDCKLFASYCQQWPCACLPLEKNQPNPKCMGMVSCLLDPCLNKFATCDAGMCGVGP